MGPEEFKERTAQALAIVVDRTVGSRRTRTPANGAFLARSIRWDAVKGDRTAGSLLSHFRSRPTRFFVGLEDPAATAQALEAALPGTARGDLERAGAVMAGRYRLFDRHWDLGATPAWQHEPISGLDYPRGHWSRIAYLEPEVGGDYKACWELSRLQHFLSLGVAYAHDGSEAWGERFANQTLDWVAANPAGRGIHWSSSLELAFRMQSWIWGLHLFREAEALTPECYLDTLRALEGHGLHVERYLSTYYSPNTHITGEALALYTAGVAFPELAAADRWVKKGRAILEHWAPIHLREDGTYFEQSTAYQRYTVDFYTQFALLERRHGSAPSELLLDRLQRAVEHLVAVSLPSGRIPLVGDDDGGRLWPLDDRPRTDHRPAFATAAVLFDRGDFKAVSDDALVEAAWLLGPRGLERFGALEAVTPAPPSQAFPEGGLYLSKNDFTPQSDYVLFDSGPHGVFNCGHAHADLLSVVVSLDGAPVLIDSGTFTYSFTPAERNRFRGGSAHNTLTIDGVGPSVPGAPFQWTRVADGPPAQTGFWSDARAFWSAHQGFEGGGEHRRAVVHLPGWGIVLGDVTNGLRPQGTPQLHFHFPPGSAPELEGDRVRLSTAVLHVLGPSKMRVESTVTSQSYRHSEPSSVLRVDLEDPHAMTLITLPPRPDGVEVERLEGGLLVTRGRDGWLMSQASRGLGAWEWETDADLLALRLVDREPVEALLVGGTRLSVGGQDWIDGDHGVHRTARP